MPPKISLPLRPKRSRSKEPEDDRPKKKPRALEEPTQEDDKKKDSANTSSSSSPPRKKYLIILSGPRAWDKTNVGEVLASRFRIRFIEGDALLDPIEQLWNQALPHPAALWSSITRLYERVRAAFEDPDLAYPIVMVSCLMNTYYTRRQIARVARDLPYHELEVEIWYLKPEYYHDFSQFLNSSRAIFSVLCGCTDC